MREPVTEISSVITHTPWHIHDGVILLGYLLLVLCAVYLLVVFVAQVLRLVVGHRFPMNCSIQTANNMCIVVGWVGLILGLLVTWCGGYAALAQLSDTCSVIVFIKVFFDVLIPLEIGFLLWAFSHFQTVFAIFLREKRLEKGM